MPSGVHARRVQAVREVAAQVLSDVSPMEVELLDPLLTSGARGDVSKGMLGFGIDTLAPVLVGPLVQVLLALGTATHDELKERFGAAIVDLFWKKRVGDRLSTAQVTELADAFCSRLTETGADAADAKRAADTLVSLLAKRPDLAAGLVE